MMRANTDTFSGQNTDKPQANTRIAINRIDNNVHPEPLLDIFFKGDSQAMYDYTIQGHISNSHYMGCTE